MADEKRQTTVWVAAGAAAVVVIILIIWAAVKRPNGGPAEPPIDANNPPITDANGTAPIATAPIGVSGTELADVIQGATTWGPSFTSWTGKPAADFQLNDIDGKTHKLSDYRGKNVLLVFWATWCGPCKMEVPHLVETRNTIASDELAILAISSQQGERIATAAEHLNKVKGFATAERINYTVLLDPADPGSMPAPFNAIQSIPSSFFIDTQGNIKIATIGMLQSKDIKAILQAR